MKSKTVEKVIIYLPKNLIKEIEDCKRKVKDLGFLDFIIEAIEIHVDRINIVEKRWGHGTKPRKLRGRLDLKKFSGIL